MFPKGPLILAYDAECSLCCRMMDRLRERDRKGLLVFFPIQGKDLAFFAPELAGRDLHGEIHGLEEGSRRVWSGGALLPHVLGRLPGWRWVAPMLHLPGISNLTAWLYRRRAVRRYQKYGKQPFSDRF
ncbi:MAG: DUF393 domain-containing protein [Holophagaceae bacterium]|nr:DUF393 domain-containing protein [Holophagaceae bacterium]